MDMGTQDRGRKEMGRAEVAEAQGWSQFGAWEGHTVLSPTPPSEWRDCSPQSGMQVVGALR